MIFPSKPPSMMFQLVMLHSQRVSHIYIYIYIYIIIITCKTIIITIIIIYNNITIIMNHLTGLRQISSTFTRLAFGLIPQKLPRGHRLQRGTTVDGCEILHQLMVYPIIYRVSTTLLVVQDFAGPSTVVTGTSHWVDGWIDALDGRVGFPCDVTINPIS